MGSTLNDAAISGEGLTGNEILGHGHENKDRCAPEAPMCDTWNDVTHPTGELSTPSPATPACIEDNECEMSDGICDLTCNYCNCNYCDEGACKPGCSTDANCQGDMVCDGAHLCQQPGRPIVFDIIVKTKSCSGCATGNTEQGLQVQLFGLLGLTNCTTDNLDNPDAHDYGSGSVAHFGKANQNWCCQLGQALTSADGFKPLSNCRGV